MNILLVLPFCARDSERAIKLLEWVIELGGCRENDCLLVRDVKAEGKPSAEIDRLARHAFASVRTTTKTFTLADESWPIGPNAMFETAIRHIAEAPRAFLWIEPDVVPTRPGWLKDIERSYARAGKPFMGQIVKTDGMNGVPPEMMSGVAVYPGTASRVLLKYLQGPKRVAWDVAAAKELLPLCKHTSLIYNIWGTKLHCPRFVPDGAKPEGPYVFHRNIIPAPTALFHRCKDTSLIEILRAERNNGGRSLMVSAPASNGASAPLSSFSEEMTIPQIVMVLKARKKAGGGGGAAHPRIELLDESPPVKLIHCCERHPQRKPQDEARVLTAFKSWERIYKAGRMTPCHVWDMNFPRHAGEIGDPRPLPYLKDILIEGMTKARSLDDIIVLTNDDTVLHPGVCDALLEKLKTVPACGSFRVNFEKVLDSHFEAKPAALAKLGKHDLGRDLFAFRKSWLRKRWSELPDFFLGELEWDLVLATMVRRDAGVATTRANRDQREPKCEIDKGLVLHEMHQRAWVSDAHREGPAKIHNRTLAVNWYAGAGVPSLISSF
jgi:hypothetical protein